VRDASGRHKFLVVDDHAPLRKALARALQPYGRVEHAATVGEGTRIVAAGDGWSALIIDVGLPDGNGLDVLARARAAGCNAPALVLTGIHDAATINRAFDLRARFLVKSGELAQIDGFIREALATERRIDDAVSSWAQRYDLSLTESEVLIATAQGCSRDAVISARGITRATFKRHVVNMLAKTGDTSLLYAVARLLREVTERTS
jgi:DNA-binding NarL/FixJ family response regulator